MATWKEAAQQAQARGADILDHVSGAHMVLPGTFPGYSVLVDGKSLPTNVAEEGVDQVLGQAGVPSDEGWGKACSENAPSWQRMTMWNDAEGNLHIAIEK